MAIKCDEWSINKRAMLSALMVQQSDEERARRLQEVKMRLAYLRSQKSMIQSNADAKSNKEQLNVSVKLLQLMDDTQLNLTQINGQRKLGPPPEWIGPPPGPKCEVFVGSIPRDFYEPEIVLIFSTIGMIYELRLMMEFSGANRGYCFIMFSTEEEAARAIKVLDKYEIYPGKRIGVVASINNCRIYLSQLPRTIGARTITKRIYEITEDVEKVCVYRNIKGHVCYVLISYKTHRSAAIGRKRLLSEATTLFRHSEINIEWANPHISPSNVRCKFGEERSVFANCIEWQYDFPTVPAREQCRGGQLWSHVKTERGYFPLLAGLRKWQYDSYESNKPCVESL